MTQEGLLQLFTEPSTLAVRMIKQTLEQDLIEPNQLTQSRVEQRLNRVLFETEDSIEGIKSFMEKKEPKYTGKW
jgi:enoyl-CoA hydratase/carnithine racemase